MQANDRTGHGAARAASDATGITGLLDDWSQGDGHALDRLMPLVTEDLRRMATAYMRNERAGHTLQPTALVNELYLKLTQRRRVGWRDRAHFFAFAATTMRRILVDHARIQRAAKRGRDVQRVALDEAADLPAEGVDLVALDDALEALARLSRRQSRIVEMRCFAGLGLEETGAVLGVSRATVAREWATARAWLYRELIERRE